MAGKISFSIDVGLTCKKVVISSTPNPGRANLNALEDARVEQVDASADAVANEDLTRRT